MFQDDTTGLRFGNFEVLVRPDGSVNELGRGGFGRTLLARHFVLDTEVALKLIDERHAMDEAARNRFLKEAREQARLSHPGIARITDCGQVDGQLYYAVELCPGGNVKEFVVKTGPLSVSDTFHLLLQAAEALEYSHRRGVVHLDIKPSNLMLVFDEDDKPQVKLIDFGLVQRTATENGPPGMEGRPLFSAAFASPEQIRSQPTDGRSDIFSLGMTGWFLLTGRNPVEGAADVVIQERLSGGDYEPQLPKQLTGKPRAVLARMIKRNPGERYANGVDLLNELRACLQGMPPLSGGWQKRQRSGGALADRFMLEKGVQSRHGTVHQAIDREKRLKVKVTLLRSGNLAAAIAQYKKAAAAMRGMEGSGLLRVLDISEFNEGWAVVEEAAQGVSLTDILRREGAKPLGRYAPLVWQISTAMDTAFAAGLTNLLLEDTLVEMPPENANRPIDWSVVNLKIPLSPAVQSGAATPDADATATGGDFTRTTTTSVAGVQLLARWVYFIVGGKNPPPSSLYSMKEYIAVPGLGDAANQILARHLCGQSSPPKCEDLIRQLFVSDGISWESVGERIRQTRWGGIIQQSGVLMDDIEQAAADAEKIANACRPFAEIVPDAVKECYACVSRVYDASTAAREKQALISQSGGKSLAAGKAAVAALDEISQTATLALAKAEAAMKEAKATAEKLQRETQQRERRRRELTESLADAWRRTEAAAKEAKELAEECRRVAPSAGAARQMDSFAAQTGALVSQLEALHREAAEVPEAELSRLESQIPQARQVAADAGEMARACHSLLERAKIDARRREEEAKLRAAVEAEISGFIQQAEQTAADAPAIRAEIDALAEECPALHEIAQRAAADAGRAAGIVEELHSLRTLGPVDAAGINQTRQRSATSLDDLRSVMGSLHSAIRQARPIADEHRRVMERFRAASAEIVTLTNAADGAIASLPDPAALTATPDSPGAAWLRRCGDSVGSAVQSRDSLTALAASLDPQRAADAGRIIEEARRFAGLCRSQASEAARHWQEADFAIKETARLEREAEEQRLREEEEARRRMEEEMERRRLEEIERQRQEAEAKRLAEEAEQRRVAEEEARRKAEEEARRIAEEEARRQAEEAERRRIEEEAARRKAEEEARIRAEAEAKRLAEEAERRRIEEEAARLKAEEEARLFAEAEAKRLAEEAERRRIEEQEAKRQAEEEAKHQAEEAQRRAEEEERRRIEEEAARLKAEEEARIFAEAEAKRMAEEAERLRIAEEARRKAEEEARRQAEEEAERRQLEEEAARLKAAREARLRAEAEAKRLAEEAEQRRIEEENARRIAEEEAEKQRLEEKARRLAQEEAERVRAAEEARIKAEQEAERQREEEARRKAAEEEKRRLAEETAKRKAEEEARRKAEAEEKRRLKEEADKRKAEEETRRKEEVEAKRKADAEAKRRAQEEAAQRKAEAESKRKAEAEEKRLKAAPAVTPAEIQEPPKKKGSKSPVLAIAASVAVIGGGVAWWMVKKKDSDPKPDQPPGVESHVTTIKFSGGALPADIQLSGTGDSEVTRDGDEVRITTKSDAPPLKVALSSSKKGIKITPAALEVGSNSTAPLAVTITRETGTLTLSDAPAASPSFQSRVWLKWAGDATHASPGTETTRFVDTRTQNSLTLPAGPWLISFDDDEPAPGKAGKAGSIVDSKDGGTLAIEAGKSAALQLPPGWSPVLYSLLDWKSRVADDEEQTVMKALVDYIAGQRFPAPEGKVKEVFAGLAKAASQPVLSYPVYLTRRDGRFYLLRPQRNPYRRLVLNDPIESLALLAVIINTVSEIKLDLDAMNPMSGAAAAGGRIPLNRFSDCLLVTREALQKSGIPAALEPVPRLNTSLNILKMAQAADWSVPEDDAKGYAFVWKDSDEPCTNVHVHSDGTVTLQFRMNEKSLRELTVSQNADGTLKAQMKEGAGDDEKDTFTGAFTPQTALPGPLQAVLKK